MSSAGDMVVIKNVAVVASVSHSDDIDWLRESFKDMEVDFSFHCEDLEKHKKLCTSYRTLHENVVAQAQP